MGLFAKKKGQPKVKPLDEQQTRFREIYRESRNVSSAAAAVGRSHEWGYQQITKPYMIDIVRAKLAEYTKASDLALDSAVARKEWLMRVIMGEETCSQTFQGKEGPIEVTSEFPPAIRAKCMELLMKVYGDFAPVKHEIQGNSISFVQVLSSRGPAPEGVEVKEIPGGVTLSLPTETVYSQCPTCQEQIEERFLEKHLADCPGA